MSGMTHQRNAKLKRVLPALVWAVLILLVSSIPEQERPQAALRVLNSLEFSHTA